MKITTLCYINELLTAQLAEKRDSAAKINQMVSDYRKDHDISGWVEDGDTRLEHLIRSGRAAREECRAAQAALDDWLEHEWG